MPRILPLFLTSRPFHRPFGRILWLTLPLWILHTLCGVRHRVNQDLLGLSWEPALPPALSTEVKVEQSANLDRYTGHHLQVLSNLEDLASRPVALRLFLRKSTSGLENLPIPNAKKSVNTGKLSQRRGRTLLETDSVLNGARFPRF